MTPMRWENRNDRRGSAFEEEAGVKGSVRHPFVHGCDRLFHAAICISLVLLVFLRWSDGLALFRWSNGLALLGWGNRLILLRWSDRIIARPSSSVLGGVGLQAIVPHLSVRALGLLAICTSLGLIICEINIRNPSVSCC